MDDLLDLRRRDQLPDALRTLLDDYPRTGWAEHRNFDGLVAFWLDRHMMFRRLCELINADIENAVDKKSDKDFMKARLTRFGGMLVQQLHGHHQIEDMHYFPVLCAKENALQAGFDILDRDHHALDELLERFSSSANAVLQDRAEVGRFHQELLSFQGFLERHLEDEEELIVPVILKHGPGGLA